RLTQPLTLRCRIGHQSSTQRPVMTMPPAAGEISPTKSWSCEGPLRIFSTSYGSTPATLNDVLFTAGAGLAELASTFFAKCVFGRTASRGTGTLIGMLRGFVSGGKSIEAFVASCVERETCSG